MHRHGLFGPGSMTWKIASEGVLNVGGARAVLMQLAHPLVAMGVSAHSRYMTDPLGRAEHTFMLGQKLTFGRTDTVLAAARTINRLHTHVYGTLPTGAGAYADGTPYDARDQELLLWVYATLLDTILLTYPMFVGPLSNAEQEHYYQESKELVRLLGLPATMMPHTVEDLRQYVHDTVYSNRLAATPQARQLAQQVLYPPVLPDSLRPFMHLYLQFTCALLPQPVRELYGLTWDTRRQRLFDLSATSIKALLPYLPTSLRVLPITRKMMGAACPAEHIHASPVNMNVVA